MRVTLLLLLTLLVTAPLAAQSLDAEPGLPGDLAITFEDNFEANGLAASWWVWDHFPEVADGRLKMPGWKSWSDAIARPHIGDSEGVLQRFRYEPGPMEFFLDFAGFDEPDFRQVRLGTSGNNYWHVYSSSGAQGVQTRTYGSVELTPGSWYYALILLGEEGEFYFQVWEADNADEFLLNLMVEPSGNGWANREWWFGNKVYDGLLEVDWFAEVEFTAPYQLPCTVRGIGSVNLREGPGTQFERVGRLDSAVETRVMAQSSDSEQFTWWQLPGDQWVRADVVRPAGDCASLPPVAA